MFICNTVLMVLTEKENHMVIHFSLNLKSGNCLFNTKPVFLCFVFDFFKTGSRCVAQAILELTVVFPASASPILGIQVYAPFPEQAILSSKSSMLLVRMSIR